MKQTKRINWTNTLFLTLSPIIAIVGTFLIIQSGHLSYPTLALALVLMGMTGLAITAGYHRLFSHRTYKATWIVRLFYLLFGAASFEGSVLEWCTDHRKHHLHVDTDQDPYNINQGFWHAHIGWLIFLDPSKRNFKNVGDLERDKLARLQHKFFVPLAIIMGLLLPAGIASLWGDFWGGLIIAGFLRVVLNQHLTFCINSVCHIFGDRGYSQQQTARDNWITALFTYGEGFHNFHHQFMMDYRNGIRFYHFDPSKWLIATLSFLGLASDLKRTTPQTILEHHVQVEESLLLSRLKQYSESLAEQAERFIQPLKQSVIQAAVRLEQIEQSYHVLKKQKMLHLQGRLSDYNKLLKEQKNQIRIARLELTEAISRWRKVLKNPNAIALPLQTT